MPVTGCCSDVNLGSYAITRSKKLLGVFEHRAQQVVIRGGGAVVVCQIFSTLASPLVPVLLEPPTHHVVLDDTNLFFCLHDLGTPMFTISVCASDGSVLAPEVVEDARSARGCFASQFFSPYVLLCCMGVCGLDAISFWRR